MKRSPIVDDATESGTSLSEDCQEPEYEVLRVEGVDEEETITPQPRKKHKSRDREKRHKRRELDFSVPAQPLSTKRLKLIFDNESHIIDLPHS